MKHSRNVRHMKDNGSAQDCRHKENYIGRQTRVTRETQLEPLKQWLSNKMGGDRQSTWEHMAPTNNKPCALHTETSGGQPGHTSRTVTDNASCSQIISDWFLEHDNEFTLLKWPPQSPDLNPIEHLWDVVEREIRIMDVQPANLQQLRDAIMSIWTKISEECFQNLVESMPHRIKAVLKAKGGPTRY